MPLTQRDRLILQTLRSYGFMRTSHIETLYFPGVATTTVLRRLRKLAKEKLIRQHQMPELQERLWMLTKKSALLFEKKTLAYLPFSTFSHDLQLVDLRFALEGSGVVHDWIPEHEIIAKYLCKKSTIG